MKKYNPDIMMSFCIYRSWVAAFRAFSVADRGILLNWMFWYCFEECEPSEDCFDGFRPEMRDVWLEFKGELDKQKENWASYCRRKNAKTE